MAVLAVCLFHFLIPHTQGGFLGVDVFFVLSGYLITTQLWIRWGDSTITLWPFWEARIRRLFPAVILLVTGVSIAMLSWGRDQTRAFLGDLLAAATYTSNWWYVVADRSYAAEWGIGRPPVLQHLWSLAVEEQFYLFWPLVIAGGIVLCRRSRHTRWILAFVSLALALLSAALMWMGSSSAGVPESGDPNRWYYGTDSHAMGLLLGAAFALLRGGAGFGQFASGRELPALPKARAISTLGGVVGLVAVIAAVVVIDYRDVWLYRAGFPLVALASLLLIAVATRPGPLASVLSWRPLRYLGTRSYSIYLWHWPVVCFTRPVDLGFVPDSGVGWWVSLGLRVLLTIAFSELSYRFVEVPVRRYGWRATVAWLGRRHLKMAAAVTMALTLTSVGAIAVAQPDKTIEEAIQAETPDEDYDVNVAPSARPGTSRPSGAGRPTTAGRPASLPTSTKEMTVAYYGDSFAVGAAPGLRKVFKSVDVHAGVSRQSPQVFAHMRSNVHTRSDVVVLHTGNNGVVSEAGLRQVLQAYAASSRVIVVLPRTPRPWTAEARDVMVRVCGTPGRPLLPHVRVADWYGVSDGHREYLQDGVHPTRQGIAAYTRIVQEQAVAP